MAHDPGGRERTYRALATLREVAQGEAEAALAEATRRHARAVEARAEARRTLDAHQARTRQALRGEPGEDDATGAFALQQAERFRQGRARSEAALQEALQRALAAEAAAHEAVVRARQALARRSAERRAVERRSQA